MNMQTTTRVIFNTIVIYVKIILSLIIALVSIPLVLKALGVADYGLYNLIAGVVAMLSFLNNSMTVSTQRFMSVAMGENNQEKINIIYNTGFLLHLILGLCIVVAFEILGITSIDKLNITTERLFSARIIFQLLVVSTFFKIIAVPFDALVNAKEDMLFFSVIELTESLLMLIVAFSVSYVTSDRLIYYGICITIISLLTLVAKFIWCKCAYREYKIKLSAYKGRFMIKSMLGFTTWNLFGGLAMIGRNQGIAVIINLFLGTIINAAYGIANQINGAIGHFSATFQKAINPQLMKSEGMSDRNRLIRISFISSKFSVLAIAFFAIPLILELDFVLSIWLKDNIPPYTKQLTALILILSIVYQYSVGLMSAIQATGKIRNYQIIMGLIILSNIPIAFYILKQGYPVYFVIAAFIFLEVASLIIRLHMSNQIVGISIKEYISKVATPTVITIIVPLICSSIFHWIMPYGFLRLFMVSFVYALIFGISMWHIDFEEEQRILLASKIKNLVKRCLNILPN